MNQMHMISKFGVFASVLLVLSLFTIFSLPEATAADTISASAKGLSNTVILEIHNDKNNTSKIKAVNVWVSTDNSFKSFQTEPGWTGNEKANGQMIVFSIPKALNPGESVKFGLVTDKKTSGINWKAIDVNGNTIDKNKTNVQEITDSLTIFEKETETGQTQEFEEAAGTTLKYFPEKIRLDSHTRLAGTGFNSNQLLQLYINDILFKTISADGQGNFKTTIKIPSNLEIGINDFIIIDEFKNTTTTQVKIEETLNRFLDDSVDFGVTGFNKEIKTEELFSVSGNAPPNTGVILTFKNADGVAEKYRIANVDSKGVWSFEEVIGSDVELGKKTILFQNLNSKLEHDLFIKSFSLINITPQKSQYDPGDTVTFIGEAEPNKNLEIIIKNQARTIIHTDDIMLDATGNIDYKFNTDVGFLKGTYIIMINQGDSSYAGLFGIGTPPVQQLIITMNKLNFTTQSTAIVNVVGPALTNISILVTDQSGNEEISTSITTGVTGHGRDTLNLNSLSSGVYTAIALKGSMQDTTKFSVGLITGSGPITLSSTKDVYAPGDRVLIIGKTGANSILQINLIDPQDNTVRTQEIFSDSNGQFSSTFRIPIDAETGIWKIGVDSRLDHAATEFNVIS